MSDDTYKATLTYMYDTTSTDFPLEYQTIEDRFPKVIVEHEYPFRDGSDLDDMGQEAHTVRISCFFYNETYELHKQLVNDLRTYDGDGWKLTHPQYGAIRGKIRDVAVNHDEQEKTAKIDLTFIEQMRGLIEPSPATSVDQDSEGAFMQGIAELEDEFAYDMRGWTGAESEGILGKTLDPSQGIFGQFSGLSKAAAVYIKGVDGYVKTLNGTLNVVANPANSLVASINYGVNLPGCVIGSLARCVERYSLLYNSIMTAPSRFMTSLCNGTDAMEDAISSFTKYTTIHTAQRCCLDFGYILKDDKAKDLAMRQAAKTPAFSPEGRLTKSPGSLDQPLTMNEVEDALAYARTKVQNAVDLARGMGTLKAAAQALDDHVAEVKKNRPKVISVEAPNEIPLHLICLKYGLSYQDAELLMGMNRTIRNPSFVRGAVNVYAR